MQAAVQERTKVDAHEAQRHARQQHAVFASLECLHSDSRQPLPAEAMARLLRQAQVCALHVSYCYSGCCLREIWSMLRRQC